MQALDDFLTTTGGRQKFYVDTGPVLERDFAAEAGIGWHGKSTMLLNRRLGTWFFLAEILTTLELPPDPPQIARCGSCTRCIDACPTGAITAPHQLDARRCISYLTIELKGSIPLELRSLIGDRIYGCDDCLEACPWNRFAQVAREGAFAARPAVAQMRLRDFLALDDEQFREMFRGSPIKRIKRRGFPPQRLRRPRKCRDAGGSPRPPGGHARRRAAHRRTCSLGDRTNRNSARAPTTRPAKGQTFPHLRWRKAERGKDCNSLKSR